MPAGPDPDVDLVAAESGPTPTPAAGPTEIAVEVRGRFGDRWVDGFEICEVMTTPSGPRYRLRRQRDGVVLPELFDATNIRHVETFEQMSTGPAGGRTANGERRSSEQLGRERSMDAHPSGGDTDTGPINGSAGYWSCF